MTAQTRRDILVELLRELYRVAPRGRTVTALHRLINAQVDCELADVEQVLQVARNKAWVVSLPADDFAATHENFWRLARMGTIEAEKRRIV